MDQRQTTQSPVGTESAEVPDRASPPSDESVLSLTHATYAPPTLFCPQCGYNLTGLTNERCPECGRDFVAFGLQSKWMDDSLVGFIDVLPRLLLAPIAGLALGFGVGLSFQFGLELPAWSTAIVVAIGALLVFPIWIGGTSRRTARTLAAAKAARQARAVAEIRTTGYMIGMGIVLFVIQSALALVAFAMGLSVWM